MIYTGSNVDTEQLNERLARLMSWVCLADDCDGHRLSRCRACGEAGHGNCNGRGGDATQVACDHRPDYAHEMAAAWPVAERFRITVSPGYGYVKAAHCSAGGRSTEGNEWVGTTNHKGWVMAETAALAICLAAEAHQEGRLELPPAAAPAPGHGGHDTCGNCHGDWPCACADPWWICGGCGGDAAACLCGRAGVA